MLRKKPISLAGGWSSKGDIDAEFTRHEYTGKASGRGAARGCTRICNGHLTARRPRVEHLVLSLRAKPFTWPRPLSAQPGLAAVRAKGGPSARRQASNHDAADRSTASRHSSCEVQSNLGCLDPQVLSRRSIASEKRMLRWPLSLIGRGRDWDCLYRFIRLAEYSQCCDDPSQCSKLWLYVQKAIVEIDPLQAVILGCHS